MTRCLSCRTLIRRGSRCARCARVLRLRRGNESQLRTATIARDGRRCANCGVLTNEQDGPTKTEVDHVVPVANGGASQMGNLVVLCRACNRRKGSK
jgi:5-methylcytosine-specific restriction endonuclease McrA